MSCARGCCERQADHYRSVVTRMPSALSTRESQTARDLDSYRRMKQQGLQPPNVVGAANVERHAESRFEVEANVQVRNDRLRADLDQRMSDPNVTTPHTDPLDVA